MRRERPTAPLEAWAPASREGASPASFSASAAAAATPDEATIAAKVASRIVCQTFGNVGLRGGSAVAMMRASAGDALSASRAAASRYFCKKDSSCSRSVFASMSSARNCTSSALPVATVLDWATSAAFSEAT